RQGPRPPRRPQPHFHRTLQHARVSPHFATAPVSPHFGTTAGFTALWNTARRRETRWPFTARLASRQVSPLFLPLPRLGAPARPSPSLDGATRDDGGPCADRRKQEISDVGQVSRAPSARQEVRWNPALLQSA